MFPIKFIIFLASLGIFPHVYSSDPSESLNLGSQPDIFLQTLSINNLRKVTNISLAVPIGNRQYEDNKDRYIVITDAIRQYGMDRYGYELLHPIALKIQLGPVLTVYPIKYSHSVNDKPFEMTHHVDNEKDYKGCSVHYNKICPEDVNDKGFIGSQKAMLDGFCCSCENGTIDYLYHRRGGQRCKDELGNVDASELASSTHCYQLNPLWLSVYKIGKPFIKHKIHVTAYVKLSLGAEKRWVPITEQGITLSKGQPIAGNSKIKGKILHSSYELKSLQKKRLLVPEYLSTKHPSASLRHRLQGGPGEYLVVNEDRFTDDGAACNKIGVSKSAFLGQSNRCSAPIDSCLQNQPFHLWQEDKEREDINKSGDYLLKFYGKLPNQVIVGETTDNSVLQMERGGTFEAEVGISLILGDLSTTATLVACRVLSAVLLSTEDSATYDIIIINSGKVKHPFLVKTTWFINDRTEVVANTDPVEIPPNYSHQFSASIQLPHISTTDRIRGNIEVKNSADEILAAFSISARSNDTCFCIQATDCQCASDIAGMPSNKKSQEDRIHSAYLIGIIAGQWIISFGLAKIFLGLTYLPALRILGLSEFFISPRTGVLAECEMYIEFKRVRCWELTVNLFFLIYLMFLPMHMLWNRRYVILYAIYQCCTGHRYPAPSPAALVVQMEAVSPCSRHQEQKVNLEGVNPGKITHVSTTEKPQQVYCNFDRKDNRLHNSGSHFSLYGTLRQESGEDVWIFTPGSYRTQVLGSDESGNLKRLTTPLPIRSDFQLQITRDDLPEKITRNARYPCLNCIPNSQ